MKVKFWLGLSDQPYKGNGVEAEKTLHSLAHQGVAWDVARQSIVLLKNADHFLPLSKRVKSVAVIGRPDAEGRDNLICRYSPANSAFLTVFEGIKRHLPGVSVKYAKGCEIVDPNFPESELIEFPVDSTEQQLMDEDVALATESEVVVMVLVLLDFPFCVLFYITESHYYIIEGSFFVIYLHRV